ncbi:MAG: SurA N-terminal domain-containing protein [Planctomycetaceae bacterium]|nr:SurA N-terminal domain-containing protein [Planctomycetaceae bacterium]
MEQVPQNAGGPPAKTTPRNRRRWLIAAGGTAVALVAATALMQVWRGGEGVAAEAARTENAGKATVGDTPPGKPRYLGRVGDAVITYDQVAEEAMARYGTEVLDQLINRTIIEIACRQRGIAVTEAEVEQEITTISQEYGLDRTAWMQMLQAERNVTPLQYKRDIIWPMLALKKLAGSEVKITDADVRKAFERDYGPKVKARMIMMDNPRRLEEIWRKANETCAVAKQNAAPEDAIIKAAGEFGRLAREHSIEPTSKALDGVIPPIRRHTGPENENVENAAFNLHPGEISGIVQLPTPGAPRYVVLFCEGQTEPVVQTEQISLVRDEIVAQLKKEKTQENVAKVFKKLQEETPVHNFLTNTATGGVQTAAGTAGPGVIRPTGATAAGSATPVRR